MGVQRRASVTQSQYLRTTPPEAGEDLKRDDKVTTN